MKNGLTLFMRFTRLSQSHVELVNQHDYGLARLQTEVSGG